MLGARWPKVEGPSATDIPVARALASRSWGTGFGIVHASWAKHSLDAACTREKFEGSDCGGAGEGRLGIRYSGQSTARRKEKQRTHCCDLSDMLEVNEEIFGSSEKVTALCKHYDS